MSSAAGPRPEMVLAVTTVPAACPTTVMPCTLTSEIVALDNALRVTVVDGGGAARTLLFLIVILAAPSRTETACSCGPVNVLPSTTTSVAALATRPTEFSPMAAPGHSCHSHRALQCRNADCGGIHHRRRRCRRRA